MCKTCNSTEICVTCSDTHYLNKTSNMCVTECEELGYFELGGGIQECAPCHSWCIKCTDNTTYQCEGCNSPSYQLEKDCVLECPTEYYTNDDTRTCDLCSRTANCATCGTSVTDCLTCKNISSHLIPPQQPRPPPSPIIYR